MALASLAGRRWGLKVGGAIGGFPVTVGPILLFYALEQGTAFAAQASLKCLSAVFPFSIFCVIVGRFSTRWHFIPSVFIGWSVFLVVSYLGLDIHLGLLASGLLAIASMLVASRLLPARPVERRQPKPHPAWDIPARMLAALLLILSLTQAAGALGPNWSGALAPFPVASTILAGFSYMSDGPYGPGATFKGSMLGGFSYAAFCAVLVLALPSHGAWPSFGMAFAAGICVQIAALSLSKSQG